MNKEIIDTIREMQKELTTWEMSASIKELNGCVESAHQESEFLRRELDAFAARFNARGNEIEDLKNKLVDSQTAFGLMTEQLRELTNENTQLADEYHRERQKVQTISKNFHDASERVTKLMAELTKETDERVSLQDQLARMVALSEGQGKAIEDLTWKVDQAEGFLKEDRIERDNKNVIIHQYEQQVRKLEADASAYKGAAESAQEELSVLRMTISDLQEQIRVLIQRNSNQELTIRNVVGGEAAFDITKRNEELIEQLGKKDGELENVRARLSASLENYHRVQRGHERLLDEQLHFKVREKELKKKVADLGQALELAHNRLLTAESPPIAEAASVAFAYGRGMGMSATQSGFEMTRLSRGSYTADEVLAGVHIRDKYAGWRSGGIKASKEAEDAEVAAWVEAFKKQLEKEDLSQHPDHRVSIPASILKNPPSTFNPKSQEVLEDLAGRMGESFADEPCVSPSCEQCEVLHGGVVSVDCGPALIERGVTKITLGGESAE